MNDPYTASWLAVCLARLPLEAYTRGHAGPEDTGGPLALCDAREVLIADPVAEATGVRPGMRRATALALCPALQLLTRDPAREQSALEQAACWALQFTPSVSLQSAPLQARAGKPAPMPSGLLLEVAPSLRLFGGRQSLVTRLRTGLVELGFHATIAVAPTPSGAWLLALHDDGVIAEDEARLRARIAPLPIACLEAARPHLDTLAAIGVRTLRDLLQLPRAGLTRRFGTALLEAIDLALGRRPDPRAWFSPAPEFRARIELLYGVENTEALLFGAQRLLTQLSGWLAGQHAATGAFEFIGEHEDSPHTIFPARFAEPVRDAARMLGVLRETLGVRVLRAPVHTLALHCEQTVPLPEASGTLFPMPVEDSEHIGRLVERLQARLGRAQVQRLLLARDHRPEAAFRIEPFEVRGDRPQAATADGANREGSATEYGTGGLPRPLWLLAQPLAIGERNDRPFWQGPLSLLAGPERIESGWWDGRPVRRDYFIAADEAGALLWLYRERWPDPDRSAGWFIHGRFG